LKFSFFNSSSFCIQNGFALGFAIKQEHIKLLYNFRAPIIIYIIINKSRRRHVQQLLLFGKQIIMYKRAERQRLAITVCRLCRLDVVVNLIYIVVYSYTYLYMYINIYIRILYVRVINYVTVDATTRKQCKGMKKNTNNIYTAHETPELT